MKFSEERIKEILHILRNPWGKTDEQIMKARHDAADYIEAVEQRLQSDGDYWKCVCGELHMEGGTYCDVCGTDRPRR